MDKSTFKRFHYRFTGRVQGVGFRYTAEHGANKLGITGWVFNDYDGSVIMEAQGTPDKLNQLLEILEKGVFIEIENIEKKEIPVDSKEYYFTVKD